MIAFVKGMIDDLTMDNVVIDVGGIGYNVKISADTAARLPGVGKQAKLYTYTCVREDAFLLYGFLSRNDLEIFKKCITVNGIGPKGALSVLSVMDADSLRFAILSGDVKAISKAPGIGARTAERLILELKDKMKIDDDMISREVTMTAGANALADTPQKQEAVAALVSLGYGQAESLKAVNAIEGVENMDSGKVLKAALKKMF
ncbi:MAG: Holliday junction branch migration protein RuvA [Bacteroidales bacterium]|nr:Holliday junction branch migration protein RuvA [Lachnoclostridium sp.]MCM1384461.1 Holliday junction branch migration protein RuvA [Lachnoclostridium sp.]MCM1464006.1 Holliday junction branch migration protein RuvA [Bacteroidales bacterium]